MGARSEIDGGRRGAVTVLVALLLLALVAAAGLASAGAGEAAAGQASASDPRPDVPAPSFRRFGGTPDSDYSAVVRRTRFGVPHVVADSIGSLAYGATYAFAEDNICTLADTYVTVSGERSKWFGPDGSWTFSGNGTVNNNLDSDAYYGWINRAGKVERLLDRPPPEGPLPDLVEGVRGMVAGYNAYLRDVGGPSGIPDPRCSGEEWVRPITEMDAWRRFFQLGSLASSGVAIAGIGGAQPLVGGAPSASEQQSMARQLGERWAELGIGSNAYAFGREATANGRGLVLGNPHFPWEGAERLYQMHGTIPGKLDVSGAALYGVPLVLIGHTRGLAWSHTVATAWRFTPFELKLVPGSPTSYFYDGQVRQMEATTVPIEVREADGSTGTRTRTIHETVHGPVFTELLGLPLFPWTPVLAFALGDVNADNFRYLNHFYENQYAQSVAEYDQIQRRYQGIPWVNSIAADAGGDAYYSMNGAVPNVPDSKATSCGAALGLVTYNVLGLPVLDGSRSACRWDTDPDSAAPGLLGSSRLPTMIRGDYVHNGNDSHWLTNPEQPMEGYERIVGTERTERTPRTRLGLVQVRDRLAGADGLRGDRFDLDTLKGVMLGNRQYLGELWRDTLVGICRSNPTMDGVDVSEACEVLAAWDLRDDLDSRGAVLFRRFASHAYPSTLSLPTGTQGSMEIGARGFSEPFDVSRPVDTPAGLGNTPRTRSALARAVTDLRDAGIPLDATLRDRQFSRRGDGRLIPIHGGPGGLGVFNAMQAAWSGSGFRPVDHGASFVMAAEFTGGRCPVRADTFVTYGQSENPTSPHNTDYTEAFSKKEWNRPPFCLDDVLAERDLTVQHLGSACPQRSGLRSATVARRGTGVRLAFRRRARRGVDVEVRRVGRRSAERVRRVARFRNRSRSPVWRPRGSLRNGFYEARFRMRTAAGSFDEHRVAFRLRRGRLVREGRHWARRGCGTFRIAELSRPTFGGRVGSVTLRLRIDRTARVRVRAMRGARTVRRLRERQLRGERTHRIRIPVRGLRRGLHRIRVDARLPDGTRRSVTLRVRRL